MTAPDAPDAPDAGDEPGLGDQELRALLARARADQDEPLRRLVTSYVTLRRLAADAIEFVETQYGAASVARVPLLARLRRLVQRDAR